MMTSSGGGYLNFINESNSSAAEGYWEPHSASIDFCESNYLLSDVVVEPHNVWSSLVGLSLLGIAGIARGNPLHEWRTFLAYFILLAIGIGSACLHATLHWCFQSSDELPMIYFCMCVLYSALELDAQRDSPKYPNLPRNLLLLSCVTTAIYYRFQHLYIIFLVTFSAVADTGFYLCFRIARRLYRENREDERNGRTPACNKVIALRFYKWHVIAYVIIALPVWTLDQFHCGYLLPIYNNLPFPLKGMTLHVVWHACAGMGAHLIMQFLCACRASTLGIECSIHWLFGILPVVEQKNNTKQA